MLWVDVPKIFQLGDADVFMNNPSGRFRGPLLKRESLKFDEKNSVLTITLEWTKAKVDPGQWADHSPMTLELKTVLTSIREIGGGRVRINIVVEGPPDPPSKSPKLITVGEIVLHPMDGETVRWRESVGPPVLAEIV